MITVWDRQKKCPIQEDVAGLFWMLFLYQTWAGKIVRRKWLLSLASKIMGLIADNAQSASLVAPFIKKYSIEEELFEGAPYPTFNAFFSRAFRPGVRPFPSVGLGSPAEGRLLAIENVSFDTPFHIKNMHLTLAELTCGIGTGGTALILRLCPVDYHRFHFPDSGRVLETKVIPGALDSVSPIVDMPYILQHNARRVTRCQMDHLGEMTFVEIGALCVGSIKQSPLLVGDRFERGQEKGYFLFGGSCVVVLMRDCHVAPDILARSLDNQETLVRLGESIGHLTALAHPSDT